MNSTQFRRVRRGEVCPVCGKPDWCLIAGPECSPTAAICARTESPKRIGRNGRFAGWLHRLRNDDGPRQERRTIRFGEPTRQATRPDLAGLARRYADAIKPDDIKQFAAELGLTTDSLCRLQVGWAREYSSYSFPMSDAAGRIVGIRLRRPRGSKWAVWGGHEGLFLPTGDAASSERLLITEGPTDCAALLDLQFSAVGRPSCTGGVGLLVELVKIRRPAEVVIIADADAPGQRGADSLAAVLLAYSTAVRIITPPAGVKDARAWKQAGATAADVLAAIAAAPIRTLTIRTERKGARS